MNAVEDRRMKRKERKKRGKGEERRERGKGREGTKGVMAA